MKQKRKHLLKKFLIFGIAFLLASCSEELYDEAIGSSNKKTIKEVKFNELYKDTKFKNLLEKVSHTSNAARTSFENQNGFTISDGFVKVIETDSVVSYTMLIERDIATDTVSFENLVIQENSLGVQKATILKYMPTQISPSIHGSFTFDGTIQKSNLAFTGFNKSTPENTIQSGCYMDVLMCNESWSGGVSGSYHIAGGSCKNIKYLSIRKVKILCPDDGGSTGGDDTSSGSDDSFGDPYSNPGSGGGGVTGNTETTPEEDVITSPVKPGLVGGAPGKTPCSELTKLTGNVANKEAIENLQTKTSEDKEYGFSISKNSTGGYATPVACNSLPNNPDEIAAPTGGNIIGGFHTHPFVVLSNPTNVTPMFSDGDLNWLFWVTSNHNNNGADKDYSEYFLTLTVPQGTFAIKIKDISKFNAFRNNSKLWTNLNSSGTEGRLDILRDLYNDIGSGGDFNAMKNALLKVFEANNAGVGLYEANADLSGWSELKLATSSANNPNAAPIKKPCL